MDELRFRRVHVAGAGGLLGAAVVRELQLAGHELQHRTTAIDAIIHCPAPEPPGRLTHRRLAAYRRAQAARASTLAADALACRARLVHVGSAFAWGDHGADWIDERTPQRPVPLGAGDADVARRLLALRDERGLDVVLVAVGLVYGPGGLFERTLWDGRARVVGWGGNYVSCVHVDDAARAVAAGLERGAPGSSYLAVDDEPVTQRALVDTVAQAAGRPRPGTSSMSVAAARVGFPLARSLTASVRARNARAKAELGWAPRFPTVREGVWPVAATLTSARGGAPSLRSRRQAQSRRGGRQ
jgi:nucleoside-diphosphate-sugar epimerase